METKANFFLIGLFTILGALGIVAFFLWFARLELDRQFAYYDIRFGSVSGLSAASDVRFAGLPVGQVVDVRLSPERDGTITVRVEVDAETPVRSDSIATIEAQGVTGVSFVAIGAGSAQGDLVEIGGGDVPVIEAGRSTLQSLAEDAPELVNETLRVVQEIGTLFGGENEGRLERILVNVELASAEFAATLDGFSGIADTIDVFAAQINRFNSTLDELTNELAVVLGTADEALASVGLLADQSTAIVASGTDTLDAFQGALGEVERYVSEDLTAISGDVQDSLALLRSEISTLRTDASALIATLSTTGVTATARLAETEAVLQNANALIARLDTASAAVEAAAARIDGLVESEAVPLLAEMRVAVAETTTLVQSVNAATAEALPSIVAEIQEAVVQARGMFDTIEADLTAASGGVADLIAETRTTLTQVTETFARANTTMAAIDGAMETGTRTLAVAESAFAGADELINQEMAAIVGDLRETMAALTSAVGTVAEDLPGISDDLSSASASATQAFARLQAVIDASAPGVQEFTSQTLPLFSGLAIETRTLIGNLDRLTQQLSRDPARAILGGDVPEFRR